MFPLAFVAGWLQGHWWGFISRNYVVWPFLWMFSLLLKDLISDFHLIWQTARDKMAECSFQTQHDNYTSKTQQCNVVANILNCFRKLLFKVSDLLWPFPIFCENTRLSSLSESCDNAGQKWENDKIPKTATMSKLLNLQYLLWFPLIFLAWWTCIHVRINNKMPKLHKNWG